MAKGDPRILVRGEIAALAKDSTAYAAWKKGQMERGFTSEQVDESHTKAQRRNTGGGITGAGLAQLVRDEDEAINVLSQEGFPFELLSVLAGLCDQAAEARREDDLKALEAEEKALATRKAALMKGMKGKK